MGHQQRRFAPGMPISFGQMVPSIKPALILN
jgi:hypothetical protein